MAELDGERSTGVLRERNCVLVLDALRRHGPREPERPRQADRPLAHDGRQPGRRSPGARPRGRGGRRRAPARPRAAARPSCASTAPPASPSASTSTTTASGSRSPTSRRPSSARTARRSTSTTRRRTRSTRPSRSSRRSASRRGRRRVRAGRRRRRPAGADRPADGHRRVGDDPARLGGEVHRARCSRERLGLPVEVDNDANLGALAEVSFGAGRGLTDVVYVRLGSGVGAGLVIDGRLHHGAAGLAGEIGHVQVLADGVVCRCGNRGCLESVAAEGAIRTLLRPAHGHEVTRRDVLELARRRAISARPGSSTTPVARSAVCSPISATPSTPRRSSSAAS